MLYEVITVLYLVGLIIAISLSTGFQLFLAILLSEIIAKFSMVLMASFAKSASIGSNSPFVELMKNRKKLLVALTITLIPLISLGGTVITSYSIHYTKLYELKDCIDEKENGI